MWSEMSSLMIADLLNALGLLSNIIGVLIVFFYAFPQPSFDGGFGLGLEDGTRLADGRTVAEHKADQVRLRVRYRNFSRLGLILLWIGFTLQLISVCV
jgi:hypothetical protein